MTAIYVEFTRRGSPLFAATAISAEFAQQLSPLYLESHNRSVGGYNSKTKSQTAQIAQQKKPGLTLKPKSPKTATHRVADVVVVEMASALSGLRSRHTLHPPPYEY